jgi:hypothetical protein
VRGFFDEGVAFFWFAAIESGNSAVTPDVERFGRDIDRPEADGQASPQKRWTVAGDGADSTGDPDAQLDEEGGDAPDEAGTGVEDADFSTEDVRDEAAERVKTLYRKIVRLLHPDAAGSLSGAELELWHGTQAAYQERDVFTLELILARCARVGTKQLRYSELLGLVEEARERLAILNHALIVLAERPSWRFRQITLPRRQALERDLRTRLGLEISQLWHERRALENRLRRMQAEAELLVTRDPRLVTRDS